MGKEVELPGSGEGPLEVSGHGFQVRTVRTVVCLLQACSAVQSQGGAGSKGGRQQGSRGRVREGNHHNTGRGLQTVCEGSRTQGRVGPTGSEYQRMLGIGVRDTGVSW